MSIKQVEPFKVAPLGVYCSSCSPFQCFLNLNDVSLSGERKK